MFRDEQEWVGWLVRQASKPARGLALGIGDDAALARLSPDTEAILSTDLFVEDVHFRAHEAARSVGHRALARALSDVAAMGGRSRFALLSLTLRPDLRPRWVREFFAGLLALAERFGVQLVGGDTAVSSRGVVADVAVVGEVARGQAVLRKGARPGDYLFVSGCLGTSALGLRVARKRPRKVSPGLRAALEAHLYPVPRCALGHYLASRRLATAMIDLSDGLSTDLHRLCAESRVGARIFASRLPVVELPGRTPKAHAQPLRLALDGGEDYELLFTVAPQARQSVPRSYRGVRLTEIGEVRRAAKVEIVDAQGRAHLLRSGGFDHFRARSAAGG